MRCRESVLGVVMAVGNAPVHYIFISTDSVYMCCVPPDGAPPAGIAEHQVGGK